MSEKITVTYKIPAPPEGWVYDGVRSPRPGELYFDGAKWVLRCLKSDADWIAPIAIREQQWRPATEADIGRTDARFRDYSKRDWIKGKLIHVFKNCAFSFAVVPDHNPGVVGRYEKCEVPTESTK